MAALQLRPGADFDAGEFAAFLAAQSDLGTKWAPRFVRVCPELPITATSKVLVRTLRAERWNCADPVWWRPGRGADAPYRPLQATEVDDARGVRRPPLMASALRPPLGPRCRPRARRTARGLGSRGSSP